MSGFELRDRDDGTVDLVELTPTVIAHFTDRTHAERYFGLLTGQGTAPGPASQPKPAATSPAVRALPAPAAGKPRKPEAVDKVAETTFAEPSDAQWEMAFAALLAGGDMKSIAAEMNVNVYKLRGKYANWRRQQKEPAQGPVAEDQEDCRLCGRSFTPSAESDGLCARCSRG